MSAKTVLLATHRPGALKLCKRIYRLEQSRLTELSPAGAEELARRYAAFPAFTQKQPEPDHVPVPEAVPAPAFAGFAPEQTQEGWWPL